MATTPRMLRTSERSSFKRCRQAWAWGYRDQLKPVREAPPLRFGTLVHKALEIYYRPGIRRGRHPADTFVELYHAEQERFGFRDEEGEWHDALELGVAMLTSYVDHWGADRRWKVISSEQTFRVPIRHPRTGRFWFFYVGTIDGVWEDRNSGDLMLIDHKTAKAISTGHLPLDPQAGAYWTFGVDWLYARGLLRPSQRLKGIAFNYLRKAMPDEREQNAEGQYLNQNGSVSRSQPPAYFHREITWRSEAQRRLVRRQVLEEMREIWMAERGKLAIVKNQGQQTCGGCGFRGMCELHESGADWEAFRDGTMTTWEPYDAHEIESEGR